MGGVDRRRKVGKLLKVICYSLLVIRRGRELFVIGYSWKRIIKRALSHSRIWSAGEHVIGRNKSY